MIYEEFENIIDRDFDFKRLPNDDNAFLGLQIIRKYLPTKGIEGADHDIIWSVDVDELCAAGITEEDVETLRDLNWMIDTEHGCLACYV
jgi:hypothetical protein